MTNDTEFAGANNKITITVTLEKDIVDEIVRMKEAYKKNGSYFSVGELIKSALRRESKALKYNNSASALIY